MMQIWGLKSEKEMPATTREKLEKTIQQLAVKTAEFAALKPTKPEDEEHSNHEF